MHSVVKMRRSDNGLECASQEVALKDYSVKATSLNLIAVGSSLRDQEQLELIEEHTFITVVSFDCAKAVKLGATISAYRIVSPHGLQGRT